MDLVSLLGYAHFSPFKGNPYLDIHSPSGQIDMSNTKMDLLGIDDKGNKKRMKAGSKNPYQFEGTTIREIPIAQMGGNPYSAQDLYNFIFEDDEEEAPKKEATPTPTAPSEEELQHQQEYTRFQQEKEAFEDQQTLAMAMDPGDDSPLISPYGRSAPSKQPAFTLSENNNPYKAGQYGKEIIADLTQDLGYTPSLNSVYRTSQQQQALVAQGWGVPNSFHLTGDAVDMKPQDWKKLPQDRQKDLRAKYDVLYHNNHYHLEPKGIHPKYQQGGPILGTKGQRDLQRFQNPYQQGDLANQAPSTSQLQQQQYLKKQAAAQQFYTDIPKQAHLSPTPVRSEYEKQQSQDYLNNYWQDHGYNTDGKGNRTSPKPLEALSQNPTFQKTATMLGTMADIGTAMEGLSTLRGLPAIERSLAKTPEVASAVETAVTPPVNPYAKNLGDLTYAKDYFSKYKYPFPDNLHEIAADNDLTDKTIKDLVNQHNTFARGVSTNWKELEQRSPSVLRHLEDKGIDYQKDPQAAAEYMATHVPINTGYGRAGLNDNVFNRGMDGVYTSNSLSTAEGYTYGDGYIVKVKKPTDFSSPDRKDWVDNNSINYFKNTLPSKVISTPQELQQAEQDASYWADRNSKDLKLLKEKVKTYERINSNPDAYIRNEVLSKKVSPLSSKSLWDIYPQFQKNGYYTITDNSYLSHPSIPKGIRSLLGDRGGQMYKSPEQIKEQLPDLLNRYKDQIAKLGITDKKEIPEYINKTYFQGDLKGKILKTDEMGEENPYAHYIHIGVPGEKVLEPVGTTRITPDIFENRSRAHFGQYTPGFSAAATIPAILGTAALAASKKRKGGYTNPYK